MGDPASEFDACDACDDCTDTATTHSHMGAGAVSSKVARLVPESNIHTLGFLYLPRHCAEAFKAMGYVTPPGITVEFL